MQHGDLDKTKVLKTQRESKSDVRKSNSKSVLNSVLPIRLVLHTGQTGWTYPKAGLVHLTCPVSLPVSRDVFRTCPVLDQTCPVNYMTVGIWSPPNLSDPLRTCPGPNQNSLSKRVCFSECPDPSWGHPIGLNGMVDRSALTTPTASFFQIPIQGTPPPLSWVVGFLPFA
jgi:hypothetical protein